MEFLYEDLTALKAPTDADLRAYFDASQDRFRRPVHFSFQQIYLNPGKSTGDVKRTAVELLTRLMSTTTRAVSRHSSYYARVIEIPTPRWTAYDRVKFKLSLPKEIPLKTQERAYTSPIWYTPKG